MHIRPLFAAAIAASALLAPAATTAMDAETAPDIVASQVRRQGHACTAPQSAVRDSDDSRPLATVWILRCSEATYRVTLVPNRGAQIKQVRR